MWLKHLLCFLAFGHRRKYLNVEVRCGTFGGWSCGRFLHRWHFSDDRIWVTRWVCSRCGKMGQTCLGDARHSAWKIEHERLVPDEKRWANFDPK
jgi:hypothetical protein